MLNPGEYQVTAKANGYSSVSRKCVVGFEPGATLCNFELYKSNWDRIQMIIDLYCKKPIRPLCRGRDRQYTHCSNRRMMSNQIPNGNGGYTNPARMRHLRLQLCRSQQKRLLTRMTSTPSMTTTLPPTTEPITTPSPTTPSPTTTSTVPPVTENFTTWFYDSWLPEEDNITQPELEITDSLDYDYNISDVDDDYGDSLMVTDGS